ncbi:uncharacterized protein LOC120069960 [Benincasa hispida]|uniref:uncharacterized protein LOC120069960 n=1 Tax=Benincasa hispida TaxID=102211 RepID=UPI0018FF6C33|nr:uncharacterized protein LOC120069960 [Benincasa hispida]
MPTSFRLVRPRTTSYWETFHSDTIWSRNVWWWRKFSSGVRSRFGTVRYHKIEASKLSWKKMEKKPRPGSVAVTLFFMKPRHRNTGMERCNAAHLNPETRAHVIWLAEAVRYDQFDDMKSDSTIFGPVQPLLEL